MENDNLLGAAVRIRRGWHGGSTGKVITFERHPSLASSYQVIKVQLNGSGKVININSDEELEKLGELAVESAIQ